MSSTERAELPFAEPPFVAQRFGRAADFQLTRFWLLRAIGFIYAVAFLIIVNQWLPLEGKHGLMPVARFLARVREVSPSMWSAFWRAPSVFWLSPSDVWMLTLGWLGLLLSCCVLAGLANAPMLLLLWLLYSSFVHVGQTFYGYGWEMLLLESGFLACFLCPTRQLTARANELPPLIVVWLFRWLSFRLMLGAGLIKLRGDECWRDLSCLVYHYQSQPNPNPLSWLLHQAPPLFHQAGVLFNHFAELVAPFGLLAPQRRVRNTAGVVTVLFQATLIVSGNLSFLNWLTIAIALSCFDDRFLAHFTPRSWLHFLKREELPSMTKTRVRTLIALLVAVLSLSIGPVLNMLGPQQAMNASFDPLHLVNSYGAFGSVGRERFEVNVEGTNGDPSEQATQWSSYEFPCKPGDTERRPCIISPYHYRLDWQLWFAGLGSPKREPWVVHLVAQLLEGRPSALSLLAKNPFPEAPPAYIRVRRQRYRFTTFGQSSWWLRDDDTEYLPALSLNDPRLAAFLSLYGWN